MRGPLTLARLDRRTGRRVFCWKPNCLGQIAEIIGSEGREQVSTLAGWVADLDGTWRESRRSKARRQAGRPPALRRAAVSTLAVRGAEIVQEGRSATNLLAGQAVFVCSSCGALSLVDPARLLA